MSSTLILIRHGRPALSRNVLLSARGYAAWWRRYDESGLRAGQRVPDVVARLTAGADVVAASPLPRAQESARLAAGRAADVTLPDMVEAPLPPPNLGRLKFRPLTWGTVSRVMWLGGRAAGGESAREARARAVRAAEQLEALAPGGRVAMFAHGWFNRMVGTALRRRGWRCVEGRGDGYWSYRRFVRD